MPQNCTGDDFDSVCIYDASDGGTDCELSAGFDIGDVRDCWVKYDNNGNCEYCDCDDCDDFSRGSSPL